MLVSDYLKTALLNAALRGVTYTSPATVYLALFDTSASEAGLAAGTLTGEVTDGTPARSAITFNAPSGGIATSGAAVDTTFASTHTIEYYAVMDAASGGNVLFYNRWFASNGVDLATFTVNNTEVFRVPAGGLTAKLTGCSTYLANALLNAVLRNTAFTSPTPYLGLFGTTSSLALLAAGTLTGEITDGTPARQAITFDAPSGNQVESSNQPSFTFSGAETVRFQAIHDASSAGNVLFYAQMIADQAKANAEVWTLELGDILVRIA